MEFLINLGDIFTRFLNSYVALLLFSYPHCKDKSVYWRNWWMNWISDPKVYSIFLRNTTWTNNTSTLYHEVHINNSWIRTHSYNHWTATTHTSGHWLKKRLNARNKDPTSLPYQKILMVNYIQFSPNPRKVKRAASPLLFNIYLPDLLNSRC